MPIPTLNDFNCMERKKQKKNTRTLFKICLSMSSRINKVRFGVKWRWANHDSILLFGWIIPLGVQKLSGAIVWPLNHMEIWCRLINTLRRHPKNVLPLVLHWTNILKTQHFACQVILVLIYCLFIVLASSVCMRNPLFCLWKHSHFLPPSFLLHNW